MEAAKVYFDVASNLASVLALIGAGLWFLYTTQFKPRIQFDLDCRFFAPVPGHDGVLAEVNVVFENKGFVEHRLYDLTLSVHGLQEPSPQKRQTGDVSFGRRLLPRTRIVPEKYGFYFVRPGVRQVITHSILLPADVALLRVTAGFNYTRSGAYPHTARRMFSVPPAHGAIPSGSPSTS
ncbi:hypothetical protein EG835_01375 [bacterium]|nr:hypothetical protein [bacterium]